MFSAAFSSRSFRLFTLGWAQCALHWQRPGDRDQPRLRAFSHSDIVSHPRRLHIGAAVFALSAQIGSSFRSASPTLAARMPFIRFLGYKTNIRAGTQYREARWLATAPTQVVLKSQNRAHPSRRKIPFSISLTGITVAARGSAGIAPGRAMAMKSLN